MKQFKFIKNGKTLATVSVQGNSLLSGEEIPQEWSPPDILKDTYTLEEYLEYRERSELNTYSLLVYNTGILLEAS